MHLTVERVQLDLWDKSFVWSLIEKLEQHFMICLRDKPYHCKCALVSYQLFNQYYLTTVLF